ncbi:hypothetical protein [Algibacter mikhailovii]|uniref:hypothetical protein n=1 Tax=Algibacter mikhailovii TaxID=425498 RepID=UPI002495A429|nr:hypothetical protein [Algibacter mikhailovii]
MRKKLMYVVISILFLGLLSCDKNTNEGAWEDNIKLSHKEINFTAESNTVLITTEGNWWWINGIALNDDWSYDISEIDTTQDKFLIEDTAFTIERRNTNEIHIAMTENQTSSARTLTIGVQAGNYFDSIKIIQSGN